jgi:hypothetical protein
MADKYEFSILGFDQTTSSSSSGGSQEFRHDGGPLFVSVQGVWNGAGITLEASYDRGTTWGTATDIITSNTVAVAAGAGVDNTAYSSFLNIPPCYLRVTADTIGAATQIRVTFSNVV